MKVENHDLTSHLKFQKLGKKIRKTSKNFGHLYLIYFFLIFETSSDCDTTKTRKPIRKSFNKGNTKNVNKYQTLFNNVHVIVLVFPHSTISVLYYAILCVFTNYKIIENIDIRKNVQECIQFYFIFAFTQLVTGDPEWPDMIATLSLSYFNVMR
jgi:hypothetical protein